MVYFKEKSSLDEGWINGGFFVIKKILKYIKNDQTFLEKKPLEIVAKLNQLKAYKHNGFWHCMDTKRDKDRLEKIISKKIKINILVVGGRIYWKTFYTSFLKINLIFLIYQKN